jgi:hypothetical protein
MAIGTIFTLFVVPSLYMLIAKDRSPAESDESEAVSDSPIGRTTALGEVSD